MTPSIWMAIIATLSLLLSCVSIFYAWYAARQRATQEELANLRKEILKVEASRASGMGEIRDRMTKIEAEVDILPSHSQMNSLTENMQAVKGDVGGMRDVLTMLGSRIERIDNYLMSEKGSR